MVRRQMAVANCTCWLLCALAVVMVGCDGASTAHNSAGHSISWEELEQPAPTVVERQQHSEAATTSTSEAGDPHVTVVPTTEKKWRALFNGKSLDNWKSTEFGGEGEVSVADGVITMQQGSEMTGIQWTGPDLPKVNYEISLEAKRVDGSDFFCGIVFPYKGDFCSFVVGGWGGGVVGLSSVDGIYASENDTASFHAFKDDTWYRIRLRVGENFVHAWIDDDQVIDLPLTGRKLSLHPALFLAKPLAIACFATVAAVRDVKFRELEEHERTAAQDGN